MRASAAKVRAFLSVLLSAAMATAGAVELAQGYRVAAFGSVLAVLAIPPIALLFIYGASLRSARPCFTALAAAAMGVALIDARSISAEPALRIVMIAAAIAVPVMIDLSLLELRKVPRFDAGQSRMAILTFWIVFLPLLYREWRVATEELHVEDGALLDRLEEEVRIDGARLVIDDLDPVVAGTARRRVAVSIGDEIHPLSAARSETVIQESRITRTLTRRGIVRSQEVKERRDEVVRIFVDLPASPVPDQLALTSVRGPVLIASEPVSLTE